MATRFVLFASVQSCEFCGGIHATSTGRIGFFKIVGESSVAAGVRRIERMTGETCENAIYALEDTLRDLKSMFNNAKDLKAVLTKFVEENDSIKKELESSVPKLLAVLQRTWLSMLRL